MLRQAITKVIEDGVSVGLAIVISALGYYLPLIDSDKVLFERTRRRPKEFLFNDFLVLF